MVLPLQHSFQVQHDLEWRIMRFQWVEPPNSRALRNGMRYCRDLVAAHKPFHVLVDFQGMPPVEMCDEL